VITGFAFAPVTSMPVLLACLPVLLIHTISVSLGSYRLIRKVREQNLQLDQLRRIDTLTGLSGRGDWEEQAEQVLRERAEDSHASLLLIDIDRFKRVNDDHGHGAGDAVLRAIAGQLRQALRPQDRAGRMGGDEFAVLLPDTPAAEAAHVAERIRHAVERVRLQGFTGVRPTVSIGIAVAEPAHDLRAWLDAADSALYRAKDKGRNRIMHNAPLPAG
jgi:diguanylate cyclase